MCSAKATLLLFIFVCFCVRWCVSLWGSFPGSGEYDCTGYCYDYIDCCTLGLKHCIDHFLEPWGPPLTPLLQLVAFLLRCLVLPLCSYPSSSRATWHPRWRLEGLCVVQLCDMGLECLYTQDM